MPRELDPGDPEDLGRLYDRLAPPLYRYALMILADPPAAEDAIQHVFASLAARGTARLQSVDGYLRRSVRNECYSALRREQRELTTVEAPLLEAIRAPDERPDERLMIERALRELPAEQREVIHLKVFEGMTFQEIADLTGESINTAASRYRYGIDKLRAMLAPAGSNPRK
jgi:RNA polymerase sigma-70 factor (ECF subfamily)